MADITVSNGHNHNNTDRRPLLDEMSEKSHGHHQSKASSSSSTVAAIGISSSRCRNSKWMLWSSNNNNMIRVMVLLILCLQNSLFTVLRRYSLGIRQEKYSKYELLLVGEIVKILFSAYMIRGSLVGNKENATLLSLPSRTIADENNNSSSTANNNINSLQRRLMYLVLTSRKMVVLAIIYGAMNILSLVSLRNIGAGMFTIFAQCKILTTACCSTLILRRHYSWTQWRALIGLSFGVLLFSEPIWGGSGVVVPTEKNTMNAASPLLGTLAVLVEVSLSGFASIYFEKVIKTDPLQLSIWERNFQLALGSVPVYVAFIVFEGGGKAGLGGGWSMLSVTVALLGAAGGLLVALSIKYGDSILKTLATTGAIILSSILDHAFLGGPLTPTMMIAGVQVILSICNYTFDTTPQQQQPRVVESKEPIPSLSQQPPSSGSLSLTGRSREEDHNTDRALERGVAGLLHSKK